MSEEALDSPAHEDERRRNRPYRRTVAVFFALAILALAVLFLRGIVRALDRLPAASESSLEAPPDVRALRACAEDLDKLERRVRRSAGELFAEPTSPAGTSPDWPSVAHPLEVERLNIAARCGLDTHQSDPVVRELASVSSEIEALLRSYALLYARHLEDGARRSFDAQNALTRARQALDARKH